MIAPLLFALAAQAVPPASPSAPPALSLEQRSAARCSAAFALVAGAQERQEAWALGWPDLRVRGKEYFVQATARLMDETGADRGGIMGIVDGEVAVFAKDYAALRNVMPACLVSLDASGL